MLDSDVQETTVEPVVAHLEQDDFHVEVIVASTGYQVEIADAVQAGIEAGNSDIADSGIVDSDFVGSDSVEVVDYVDFVDFDYFVDSVDSVDSVDFVDFVDIGIVAAVVAVAVFAVGARMSAVAGVERLQLPLRQPTHTYFADYGSGYIDNNLVDNQYYYTSFEPWSLKPSITQFQ